MTNDTGRGYPPIGSLAAIGDGRSLALLDSLGHIQWYCPLRFDNPPLVWTLLDHERGGCVGLDVGAARPAMSYLPDTGVVLYEWSSESGRARATVAIPFAGGSQHQDVVWHVEGIEGSLQVDFVFDPRPEFADEPAKIVRGDGVITMQTESFSAAVAGSGLFHRADRGMRASRTLAAGDQAAWVIRVSHDAAIGQPEADPADARRAIDATMANWREWVKTITYQGPYRENVVRSAIALKQLIYEPSGAVVAAATTSLPEEIGGVRNWDYRYTWLRDASFTLNALYQLGCTREARRYAKWMCDATAAHGLPLRVLYGIDASTEFPEKTVDHAEGYRGSRPVRIGNGAETQFQLDSYGELLDCLTICEVMGDDVMREEWPWFRSMVDFVADHWREPDSGIWEVRDRPRHFVHSKVMAWVALQRASEIARNRGLDSDVDTWRKEAELLREEVHDRGVLPERDCFGRAYGESDVDASLLMLPLVGFIDSRHPTMHATVEEIVGQLTPGDACAQGLLYRYQHDAGDGLPGGEGAFTICSFWLVEALTLAGRRDEAEKIFAGLVELQGELGLFAEEIDPVNGIQLGNFPQAFTHIGLINAALRLFGETAKRGSSAGP